METAEYYCVESVCDILNPDMRILLADDSPTMCRIIHAALEHAGLKHVTVVHDGDEAWEVFQHCDFDLVLSDQQMPHMCGDCLLEAIRQGDRNPGIPFIMITVAPMREDVINAVRLGVSSFIVKPFSAGQLLAKVVNVLTRDAK
ncbi:response regulator [Pseudodesulfovibrio cashew]|uniref:Response regulator n=1 Tax=Pseudodesulfovibrio cashew TaxID=2678688 RepID=A0A6I6JJS8_9BACT|nr:response regulator [Pseudodesulfovibrio cashew]QGY41280.1 response regulator [Pseudodesulfovibrio cashew]